MRIRQNENSYLLHLKAKQGEIDSGLGFLSSIERERERESPFSLDFRSFRPSVLDGARSKVDLHGEGYVWTLIWWSSDNSKR